MHATDRIDGPSGRDRWIIVLAGGSGARLAHVARRRYGYERPKQFCDFDGRGTLLARTLRRAERLVPRGRILVVTTRRWRAEAAETLTAFPGVRVVEQPEARDTTAAIALPVLEVLELDPDRDAVIAVMPSDHDVRSVPGFVAAVRDAFDAARAHPERLVLLGARVHAFDDGYGWVMPDATRPGRVAAFHEKPDAREGARLVAEGALVNTFVVVGSGRAFADALRAGAPRHWDALSAAFRSTEALRAAYGALPSSNFSKDVLERDVDRLSVVELPPCGWSDVGTPDRLERSFAPDDAPEVSP